MAFNAETYRMNQYRKSAWKNLAIARDIKARTLAGEAYAWEADRVATFVKLARSDMRLYLLVKRQKGLI
jgi:hypothetical protein